MSIPSLRKLAPQLEADLIAQIELNAKYLEVGTDAQLLNSGAYVHSVPFVLSGLIRVSRRDADKELLLYYIRPGEMCIMSFSACCSNSASLIVATTIEETSVLLLPAAEIRKWLREFPTLSDFVFSQYNSRYLDLMETINQLIFNKLDERILSYLTEKAAIQQDKTLFITHQQIANDLGSAREVVSRLMKKLEGENKIVQGRNQVKIN